MSVQHAVKSDFAEVSPLYTVSDWFPNRKYFKENPSVFSFLYLLAVTGTSQKKSAAVTIKVLEFR